MSKVAIIGSNGLLSDQTARYCIENGFNVEIFGLEEPRNINVKFHKIDLLSQKLNFEELSKFDIIVYASGAGIQSNLKENYDVIYSLNTFVPIDICNNLSQRGYQGVFVTFGSYFEIGSNTTDIKFSEQELSNSMNEVPNSYCISKRLLTRYVNSATQTFRHLHLILPTIYGPIEAPHRLIPYTLNAINKGETPQFTAGNQVRQYIFINDAIKIIFDLSAIIDKSEIFNIAGSDTFTVKEVVEAIYSIKNAAIPPSVFGTTERADVGMVNLQIDDTKLKTALPNIDYTPFSDVITLYK